MATQAPKSTPLTRKYRNCVFTYNNPSETPEEFKARLEKELPLSYLSFQKEAAPETGTIHYQGYAEFTRQVVGSKIHEVLRRNHFEARRGTPKEASDYTQKAESRLEGPWKMGELSKQGERTDLAAAVNIAREGGIRAVAEKMPEHYVQYRSGLSSYASYVVRSKPRDEVRVTLYLGPSGCGKTRACWLRTPDLISIPGDLKWFDNYMGDPTILFDEFDGARSKVPLKDLLMYLDRYPLRLPIKGGFVAAQWTSVYITSNLHPRDWYDWTNRESQYPALKRRVHEVFHWKRLGDDPVRLTPDHVDWDNFWRGPQPAPKPVMGPMDDYVEHEQRDYYNFY